jgi:hypothetical protein
MMAIGKYNTEVRLWSIRIETGIIRPMKMIINSKMCPLTAVTQGMSRCQFPMAVQVIKS